MFTLGGEGDILEIINVGYFCKRINKSVLRQAPKSWSDKIRRSSSRSRRADGVMWPPNCLGLNPDFASYQLCDLENRDQNFFQSPASMSVFYPDKGVGNGEEAVPLPTTWRGEDKIQGACSLVRCAGAQCLIDPTN